MGSKGIRPRKRRRPLPNVPLSREDDIPPGIMWPEEGSGFEANQYSPAGHLQRVWWLIRACRTDWRARVLVALFIVLPAILILATNIRTFVRGVF